MVTLTLTLTQKEFELLSQALGEAVARAETSIANARREIPFCDNMKKLGPYIKGLETRSNQLVALMRKVDVKWTGG